MSNIRTPRKYDPAIKSLDSWDELKRWGTNADQTIIDIIASIAEISRELNILSNRTKLPDFLLSSLAASLFDSDDPEYRDGDGGPGVLSVAARRDHVHPTDYALAKLSAAQTTNLGSGDHVKWDGSDAISGITLDTATAYTASAGASIGRFTLEAGKTYRLRAGLRGAFSGNTGTLVYRWAKDDGTGVGRFGVNFAMTVTSHEGTQGEAVAIVTPSGSERYEVRFTAAPVALSSIDDVYSYALVETI